VRLEHDEWTGIYGSVIHDFRVLLDDGDICDLGRNLVLRNDFDTDGGIRLSLTVKCDDDTGPRLYPVLTGFMRGDVLTCFFTIPLSRSMLSRIGSRESAYGDPGTDVEDYEFRFTVGKDGDYFYEEEMVL
jgi:hypothetical protein